MNRRNPRTRLHIAQTLEDMANLALGCAPEIVEQLDGIARALKVVHTCAQCGIEYAPKAVKETNRFCSIRCRHTWNNRKDFFTKKGKPYPMSNT